MLQLLRPDFPNLPCLYSTFHLEYPSFVLCSFKLLLYAVHINAPQISYIMLIFIAGYFPVSSSEYLWKNPSIHCQQLISFLKCCRIHIEKYLNWWLVLLKDEHLPLTVNVGIEISNLRLIHKFCEPSFLENCWIQFIYKWKSDSYLSTSGNVCVYLIFMHKQNITTH